MLFLVQVGRHVDDAINRGLTTLSFPGEGVRVRIAVLESTLNPFCPCLFVAVLRVTLG